MKPLALVAIVPLIALVVGAAVIETPMAGGTGGTCITIYRSGITGHPGGLALGPDGKLWFTEVMENKIGFLDPKTGKSHEIQLPPFAAPRSPLFTPDGKMWFTSVTGRVGFFDRTTGKATFFSKGITPTSVPHTPTAPGNGFLYFTEEKQAVLAKLDMKTGVTKEIRDGLPPNDSLHGIATDPDHVHIWAARQFADQLVRFDTRTDKFDKTVQFPKGSGPHDIRFAKNGEIFTTLQHAGYIGEYDPRTGRVSRYKAPGLRPNFTSDHEPADKLVDILVGADGKSVYATSFTADQVYKLDLATKKVTTSVCGIPPTGASLQIVNGPDGHIWYADPIRGAIVRVDRMTK